MRFVVITLPPETIRRRIDALRRPLNQIVGAGEALRYPPHLTLRTGLVCPDEKAKEVAEAFLDHASQSTSIPVRTEGIFFSVYGPPGDERGIVGWSVRETGVLFDLHRKLLGFTDWQKGPQGTFRPHLTLAFHDLRAEDVETLRKAVGQYETPLPDFSWTLDHVALFYECPDGWVEWGRVELGSPG